MTRGSTAVLVAAAALAGGCVGSGLEKGAQAAGKAGEGVVQKVDDAVSGWIQMILLGLLSLETAHRRGGEYLQKRRAKKTTT